MLKLAQFQVDAFASKCFAGLHDVVSAHTFFISFASVTQSPPLPLHGTPLCFLPGNPAAVLLLPFGRRLGDHTRKAIAAENNLSETAFVEELTSRAEDSFARGFT